MLWNIDDRSTIPDISEKISTTIKSVPPAPEQPRWLNEQEQRAWRGMALMEMQLTARLARELAADGLSYQDYAVLAGLTADPDGRLRLLDLGMGMGWEKSRLSHHVTRMVDRGLVTRQKCPTDMRGSFVVITDAGRRAIEAAAPAHVEAVRKYFIDLLTADQIQALGEITGAVLENLTHDCELTDL